MDSNFRAFWLAPVTWNILGYSLFCERREKWRVVSRKFQKKKLKKRFFYPSDLVNTKTTIPLRVGEERWIHTSTLRVSVYIHHYSPPLRGIVVYDSKSKCRHKKQFEVILFAASRGQDFLQVHFNAIQEKWKQNSSLCKTTVQSCSNDYYCC